MKNPALALVACLLAVLTCTAPAAERQTLDFNSDWRFHLGDIPFPTISTEQTYASTKTGNAGGAASYLYDDTTWRQLDLPHDWVVEGPFDSAANGNQGYRPRGIAWYRKTFKLSPDWRSRHVELQFDGVATQCTVWVNGIEMHRNLGGYTGFALDLTPIVHFGDEPNTVAVRVDAEKMEGWWYEGGGIYRSTRLVVRAPVHVVTDGLWANPVRSADGSWRVPVELAVENSGSTPAEASVKVRLLDPSGAVVVERAAALRVPLLDRAVAALDLPVAAPLLWSVDAPRLYRVEARVSTPAGDTDEVTTACGFRTLRFDAKTGFYLNDQPLKIKGTCNHQDHLGVGVAVPDALWAYRVRRLKEMGSNAYRCAHNPPARAFLDECDRQGLLVMDENRIFNVSPEYVRQLEWMVRRDRNHPSVFLWSVFNEEPMQATPQGYEMVRRLAAVVRRLDPTRPVTAAMSGGHLTPLNVSHAVDVVGFNYQQSLYDDFHAARPDMPIVSSEDTSAFMQRDEYRTDAAKNLIASYDDDASDWGATHTEAWRAIDTRPFVAGAFVWTGFDYRGEPTPYKWPSVNSVFGCMDAAGFPKTAYYLHQAHWIKDRPILQIVPHWNWPGREKQPIRVKVLTNAPRAELFLNGRSLGEKPVDPYTMADWQVPYEPGALEAVARDGVRELARQRVETTGPVSRLELVPDRATLQGDGRDTIPVTVRAVDASGRVVPDAATDVRFQVRGPLALIGLGNGDPNSHQPEKGDQLALFHGLGQLIVQSAPAAGEAVIEASSPGLASARLVVPVLAASAPASLPATPLLGIIRDWKLSPPYSDYPDANAKAPVAGVGKNYWQWVAAPARIEKPGANWYQWRAFSRPFIQRQIRDGALLSFARLAGCGEVWIDGRKVAEKTSPDPAAFSVPLPPGAEEHRIVVLLRSPTGAPLGIDGTVSVDYPTPP